MPASEAPSFSSTRVQRVSRINSIESTRLDQQLQGIEKAKQHQCRLTNQDIRLVSISLDYIQSSSGHSPEAWKPYHVEDEEATTDVKAESPCFMYGERILSRKMRRVQRPMSAVERALSEFSDSCSVTSDGDLSPWPKSSPDKERHVSTLIWSRIRDNSNDDHDFISSSTSFTNADNIDKMSNYSFSLPSKLGGGRPTAASSPKEAWENDTSAITKRILKSQACAQSGKRQSVYMSASDVMTSQSSKKVRGLARKIRLSSTPVYSANSSRPTTAPPITTTSTIPRHVSSQHGTGADKSPRQQRRKQEQQQLQQQYGQQQENQSSSATSTKATIGEILSQHRPTLNAGEWRNHLKNSLATPISVSTQRRAQLEVKKQFNETELEEVNEKVKHFIRSSASGSASLRRKSIFT